jgi:hypothetical protein
VGGTAGTLDETESVLRPLNGRWLYYFVGYDIFRGENWCVLCSFYDLSAVGV